jgi:hypothetical protein
MSDAVVVLSDSTYDKLKPITQVWLPAAGSLYFGLSQIWGFPAGEGVVGSIALLTTFFGVILGISSKRYSESGSGVDGNIVLTEVAGGKKIFTLELDIDPNQIENRDTIVFAVKDAANDEFWEPEA